MTEDLQNDVDEKAFSPGICMCGRTELLVSRHEKPVGPVDPDE